MAYSHLSGLIAAPFTPMKPNGEIDPYRIEAYYQFLKKNRVTGAFICGSTGEGVSLSSKEKMIVAEAWAQATASDPNFKVMTLVGGTSLTDAKEIARHTLQLGLYAVSFTAPYYFKPSSVQALADCCREVAAEVPDMPFYYYHIPVLNGCNFPMIDLLREVENSIPNFAGIKYTHEDFMDFLSCALFANKKFDMLWGRDENMLPALAVGAKGAVGSTFNYAAPLYHQLITAYENGNQALAEQLQQKSIDMIRLLGKYGGIATGKAYMKLVGMDCGAFRLPVKNMDAAQFVQFSSDVDALNFRSFCSAMP